MEITFCNEKVRMQQEIEIQKWQFVETKHINSKWDFELKITFWIEIQIYIEAELKITFRIENYVSNIEIYASSSNLRFELKFTFRIETYVLNWNCKTEAGHWDSKMTISWN